MTSSTARDTKMISGAYRSTAEVEELVRGFEDLTLPYERWTHAAHLTVAFWYLVWYGPDEALPRVRNGIRRFNAANADKPMRVGYHETITCFWMWVVRQYLVRTPFTCSLSEMVNGLIATCLDRDLPFTYFSRDHLMSDEARARFVEPDLRPLR